MLISRARRVTARATLAIAAALALLSPAQARAAITPAASTSVWYVNSARSAAHVPALSASTGGLSSLAWQHSCEMARAGRLYHTVSLGSKVGGWRSLGENVGVGPSVAAIHKAFMASLGHRANVLSTRYRTIGAGVCRDGAGSFWVTHIFFG